ncbi:coadhesin-like [Lingula anatina]|uniref:Coadhesin-like n=1 Tax=Lingula anatina TaxID=7574 RepID=A0A2R2MQK8_LINAN|nr:coadhesin-like [Lingula anatina]|eukprot:XP_023932539.1 coadhesin-like [Lingula anatina]
MMHLTKEQVLQCTCICLVCLACARAQVTLATTPKHPAEGQCEWKGWSPCSASCGGGIQARELDDCCHLCVTRVEARSCNQEDCSVSVNGYWGEWSGYGDCSATCGGGIQLRTRSCDRPSPTGQGRPCPGQSTEIRTCNEHGCPVNGNWSEWCECPSKCSVTCGGGVRTRTRVCSNPAPANGGADCVGPSQLEESCNTLPCGVDSRWSPWSKWSSCDRVSCTTVRTRTCLSLNPQSGHCFGQAYEKLPCAASCCFGTYRLGYSASPQAQCHL